ncbi:MAG: extracellular solute-binding protein, partial [Lachnospiraceae bacterium]|nr:extracellular solute-binding protein [Lachnospiraceae bacterium]
DKNVSIDLVVKGDYMKKRIMGLVIIVAIVGVLALAFSGNNAEYVEKPDEAAVVKATKLLADSLNGSLMYSDWIKEYDGDITKYYGEGEYTSYPEKTGECSVSGKNATLEYGQKVTYKVNVPKAGLYIMRLNYKPVSNTMSDFAVSVTINGAAPYHEMKIVALPLLWSDETKDYITDSYGDEIAPKQIRYDDFQNRYFYSGTYVTDEPMLFELKKGENKIVLESVAASGLMTGELLVSEPLAEPESYKEYISKYQGVEKSDEVINVDATAYTYKNSTQAIYMSKDTPSVEPYNVKNKLLNSIKFTEPGTELYYSITPEKTGLYALTFHYLNEKEEYDAFESIYINGEIPFKEFKSYAFKPTGSTWANETLKDSEGEILYVYLEAGKEYEICLKSENEAVTEAWRCARLISEHVAWFSLEISKVTGADKDKYRTWNMTKFIPEIPDYLEAYVTLIQHIRYLSQDNATYGINSALLSDMDKALMFIEQMQKYPEEIALYTEKLTGRDNSVLVAMSNFTSQILTGKFTLDTVYLTGDEGQIKKAEAGFFKKFGARVKKLALSFTDNKYSTKTDDEEVLTVWVNRAVTHVDLLQKMIDSEFTPKKGIKVKVSIMPDANKLTLAAAADKTPDVALGLSSHMPFELACRDALYDLSSFDDFWEVADRFTPGAFVSYVFNEGVYALPETLNFYTLVYRKDIYESLSLTPPDTWDDVVNQLPELQRFGMNFYHNISAGVGYKWFYQTVPLIFQNDGKLYAEDGLSTAIDRPEAVKGVSALGNLFMAYSLDKQVNSFFNSFRYSILPVGIIDSSEYILLKNGAPELEGQWALAPYPGTVKEDGSVSRWYVANGTGAIVFKETKKANEAWEFLKWWTEKETQVDYTYTLRSTYGKEFFWIPSNLEALNEAPIDREDKDVIMDSIKWLRDVPRSMGQYLVERSLSDIWNKMINEGVSAQVVIDEQTIPINREIKKKMKELGYTDEDGNLIKPYVIRDIDWVEEQIEAHRKQ